MSDEPTTPDTDPVSFVKSGPGPAGGKAARNRTTSGEPMPAPPKTVRNAMVALALTGVGSIVAAVSLFGLKGWLFSQAVKSNNKLKASDRKSTAHLHHAVDTTVTSSLVASLVLALALVFAGRAVWKGRYWSRWAVIGLWILGTFTQTFAGFTYVLAIASSEPIGFKLPSFVAAVSFIAAVVLVSLKPSSEYFNLTRPARPEGAGGRRGGLFGPRPAREGFGRPTAQADRTQSNRSKATAGATRAATTRPVGEPAPDRARAKQRAAADSAAKGAELARARAKASKSRRTGV